MCKTLCAICRYVWRKNNNNSINSIFYFNGYNTQCYKNEFYENFYYIHVQLVKYFEMIKLFVGT